MTKQIHFAYRLLPSTVVLPSSYCELVSYYRLILGDALLRDRMAPMDADIVHSPALAAFLNAIDQSDIMDGLRVSRVSIFIIV